MKNKEKKVAIVTGAGGGVGTEICVRFVRQGVNVCCTDIDTEGLKKTEELLERESNGQFMMVEGNLCEEGVIEQLVKKTMQKWGRISILVNNAGINIRNNIEEISKQEWDKVMDINLWVPFHLCQIVSPIMIKQKEGCIINIASVAAKVGGVIVGAHYSISKAGVICLTKLFAKHLAPYVRVNSICPGPVDTPFHQNTTSEERKQIESNIPLKRFARAEEIANVVEFLCSDKASYMTGEIIDVDGGITMD